MDDQNQQRQQTDDQDGQNDPQMQAQKSNKDQLQEESHATGSSPEAASFPQQKESQPQQTESGYEKIRQIEKAAEGDGQKEDAPRPQQQKLPAKSQKKQKPKPKTPEKKEPPVKKPRYFGYQPPPSLANDANYIKRNAGSGDKKESKTWLLIFLDRLLKKEGDEE